MPDPIARAARDLAADAFDVLRRAVTGASEKILDDAPGSVEHTNSIAVLTSHALGSTRSMLCTAFGLPVPPRDRDAEFAARSGGADRLLGLIDVIGAECLGILDAAPDSIDWGTARSRPRPDGSAFELPAAYWVLHAIEHLRGHADEAMLTRHLADGP